jgi:Fe2+ transport system protein FeoA
MPLSFVKSGERVRIAAIDSGDTCRCKLAEMGMLPGTEIEVIANSSSGPFIVGVKGSRIMLGRGIAQKILVE